MQERDGTVVFVEVRLRTHTGFCGAGESISAQKQRRLIQAARYFLMRYRTVPAARFDVVAFEDEALTQPLWLRSAFEVRDNG
jgi:putative endonuclease